MSCRTSNARRRVIGITGTAISTVLVMGSLTAYAWKAQKEANDRRADAEGLIEFMLTDLKDKLEPVGRLEVLDAVGQEATEYYDGYETLDANANGRRAVAYHLLGDIQNRLGNKISAARYFDLAFNITERQLQNDQRNPDRVFEHAQSLYWLSRIPVNDQHYEEAHATLEKAFELSNRLFELEGNTDRAICELAYSQSNLGRSFYRLEQFEHALEAYEKSIPNYEIISNRLGTARSRIEYSNRLNNLSQIEKKRGNHDRAFELTLQRLEIIEAEYAENPEDYFVLSSLLKARSEKGGHLIEFNRYEEAFILFKQQLEDYDYLLNLEPDYQVVKDRRWNTVTQLISLADQLSDASAYLKYKNVAENTLEKESFGDTNMNVDHKWAVVNPLAYYSGQIGRALETEDYVAARNHVNHLGRLKSKLANRDDFFADKQIVEFTELFFRSFLFDDQRAFENLLNHHKEIEDTEFAQVYDPYLDVLAIHFGVERDIESPIPDHIMTGNFFRGMEKLYPHSAQTIKSEHYSKGDKE